MSWLSVRLRSSFHDLINNVINYFNDEILLCQSSLWQWIWRCICWSPVGFKIAIFPSLKHLLGKLVPLLDVPLKLGNP